MTTPLYKWLSLSGPKLYDINEYDDILLNGRRWGDMKLWSESNTESQIKSFTDKKKIAEKKLLLRLKEHEKEINEG